ncbi:MAG: DUF4292 domain-containing protein [Deltaproteobacteria bacterium]|nr:DUF4292 domain-containing protein [Deltaproteobacteria bacterium]
MKGTARVALALVGLGPLLGAHCLTVVRPYPPPKPEAVLAAIEARGRSVRTLRAEARMTHETAQGKVKATVRMLAEAGGKLRFDVVSPFDTPLATLVADGKEFALLDAQQNRHFHGPAAACNLARLLRVALEPNDVVRVLAGATPVIAHQRRQLAWDDRAGVEVLTLHGAQHTQLIELEAGVEGGRPRWEALRSEVRGAKGEVILRIVAKEHQTVGGVRLPSLLEVSQPTLGTSLELTFKQQEVNVTLPAAAFELPAAGGLPSQRVECHTALRTP